MRHILPLVALLAALPLPAAAQSSANYKLTESSFNAGGDPYQGTFAASASHRITLDALGDAVASSTTLTSTTYHMDGGFVGGYTPPGEVMRLLFANRTTLRWDPEKSIGSYNLYRDLVTNLVPAFGNCYKARIATETWPDASTPPSGNGYFYLVTARNRLDEEGVKGYQSSGAVEPNLAPCP